jgi:tetratricopeptide (TPR) repeat protein
MGAQESKENISTSSIGAGAITTALSHVNRPRQRIAQNFRLIWVDSNIDKSKEVSQNIVAQLRSVVNDVNIFTQPKQCIQFLNELEDEKVFVIISESLGQELVPNIHNLPQVDAIYIFCRNKSQHEKWTKEWIKIKGIHTEIKPICQALRQAAKQCNQDSIAMSFVSIGKYASSQNLDQLEPAFIYTQIFKEILCEMHTPIFKGILFEMERDEKSITNLTNYCRGFYNDNIAELATIDEFEHSYTSKTPIWWYTRECFTYQMLNRALRRLEVDTIINMGFFICDLHEQIQQIYQKQVRSYQKKSFTVYHGQGLLKTDFEKLVKTRGGLMSFNNFLSTSTKREVSLVFAEDALTKTNMIGILFQMIIDPSVSSAPFASIREVSYYKKEEEILFSMHTVFRIGEINKIDNNSSLYQVDLEFTADDDQQLRTLTERIEEDVDGEIGWKRLGQLLLKLKQFDKAEELYNVLLEQASYEGEKAHYYHQLGYVKRDQGDYQKAVEYYEKELKTRQKTLPPNHLDLATSYNNIGGVYKNVGEYSKALPFYEKALEIKEKSLPPNHPSIATSYNNIGLLYDNMGEYSKALSFLQKIIEVQQKALPKNHPSFAASYNNIGSVYKNMGDFVKALAYYKCALKIFQSSLPSNHPKIKTVQANIELLKKKL